MKKMFFIIIIVAALIGFNPKQALAASLSVSLMSAKLGDSSYTDATSIQTGQTAVFSINIVNPETGTTANGVFLKVTLPTSNTNSHTITANVTSTDAGSATDTTGVTISNTTGHLEYKNSTTVLNWNSGSFVITNGLLGDSITTSTGISFPPLLGGNTYTIQITFLANVVAGVDVVSSSTTSTSSTRYVASGAAANCPDGKPSKTQLLELKRSNPTSVALSWSKANGANNYAIMYGFDSRKYQFGITKTTDITDYTINDLDPNTKYYFTVIPINGCMPGDVSNELVADSTVFLTQNTKEPGLDESQSMPASPDTTAAPTETGKEEKKEEAKTTAPFTGFAGFETAKKVGLGILGLAMLLAVIRYIRISGSKKPVEKIKANVFTKTPKMVKKTATAKSSKILRSYHKQKK